MIPSIVQHLASRLNTQKAIHGDENIGARSAALTTLPVREVLGTLDLATLVDHDLDVVADGSGLLIVWLAYGTFILLCGLLV